MNTIPTPRQLSARFHKFSKRIHALKEAARNLRQDGCVALGAHAIEEIRYCESQQRALQQQAVELGYNQAR